MTETKNNSKRPLILKILIAILSVVLIIVLIASSYYKAAINVADKHIDEYDYTTGEAIPTPDYKLDELAHYDSSKSKNLFITLPKLLVYNEFLKFEDLNKSLIENHNVCINKIGYVSDPNDASKIIVSIDGTYKWKKDMNAYCNMFIKYEFTEDNGFKLIFNDLTLGDNVPKFLYSKYIPYKQGDVLYELKSEDVELLKDETIKLSNVLNVNITKENVELEADLLATIKDFITNSFGIEDGEELNQIVEELTPIIMDIVFGVNNFDANSLLPEDMSQVK